MIPLIDIAHTTGHTLDSIRTECAAAGIRTADDWAGRDAVPEDDARALVQRLTDRATTAAARRAAHAAAAAAWAAARDAAALDGAQEEVARAERGAAHRGVLRSSTGRLTPAERSAARRTGALRAGARYERRHRRPEIPGLPGTRDAVRLLYIEPHEEGSLVATATAAVHDIAHRAGSDT